MSGIIIIFVDKKISKEVKWKKKKKDFFIYRKNKNKLNTEQINDMHSKLAWKPSCFWEVDDKPGNKALILFYKRNISKFKMEQQ